MAIRLGICGLALLVGCSSASPDPAAIAAELPAARELTAEQEIVVVERVATALSALELGDVAAARTEADRALALDPRAARAIAVRAITRQRVAIEEDPPILALVRRAEGELRLATRIAPDDPVVARLHARFLADDGHLTAAAERAEAGLVSAPDDLDLLELAGACRYELGDERLAVAHLAALVARRPGDSEALYRLGESHARIATTVTDAERSAGLEAAATAFAAYVELRPDDPAGYLGEAYARFELLGDAADPADTRAVLALLERASEADPESPHADFDRGVVLDRLGRVEEAREAYVRALERAPEHVPSLLNLAANQADAGLVEEARATCRRALALELSDDHRRRLEEFLATPR